MSKFFLAFSVACAVSLTGSATFADNTVTDLSKAADGAKQSVLDLSGNETVAPKADKHYLPQTAEERRLYEERRIQQEEHLEAQRLYFEALQLPLPAGEPTVVAQKIILESFEFEDCPVVVEALRLGDQSIRARCSNNEVFRVFRMMNYGGIAMRCSSAQKLGVRGC